MAQRSPSVSYWFISVVQNPLPRSVALQAGLSFLRPEFSVVSKPVLFLSSAVPPTPLQVRAVLAPQ